MSNMIAVDQDPSPCHQINGIYWIKFPPMMNVIGRDVSISDELNHLVIYLLILLATADQEREIKQICGYKAGWKCRENLLYATVYFGRSTIVLESSFRCYV